MKRMNFELNHVPHIDEPLAICLGYFDGYHLGHQELVKNAKKSTCSSALLTLDMKNNEFLKHKKYITSLDDREKLLKKEGIDYYFVLNFDKNVKNLSPEEFIQKILIPLNVKEIFVGEDYTFGINKEGNVDTLKKHQNPTFDVHVIPSLKMNEEKISTTLILNKIKEGKVQEVISLLGRPFTLKGSVKKGLGNGKKYLYPTANIMINEGYIMPKKGVYYGTCIYENKKYKAMINLGTHPTIDELSTPILEIYLLNFNGDLYHHELTVEFKEFMREEIHFASIEELKKQLEKDYLYVLNKEEKE